MRHRPTLDLPDLRGKAAGQRHPPGGDAEQDDLLRSPGPLDDLVGDPGQRPAYFWLLQDGFAARQGRSGRVAVWAAAFRATADRPGRPGGASGHALPGPTPAGM